MDPIWFYHVLHSGLGIAALLVALATLTVVLASSRSASVEALIKA